MIRRIGALWVALVVAAFVAVPSGAADAVRVGTARTDVSLLSVTLDGLPIPLQGLTLGTLQSFASTDTDTGRNAAGRPFARSAVALPVVGEVAVTSDEQANVPARTIALPGGVGTLSAGELSATVDDGVARALIGGLSADITATVAGLTASVPSTGALSVVDASGSMATNGATLSGLSVGLTDLVPLSILEQLPLGTLLDLAGGLPIELPVDVTGVVNEVRALIDQVGAVEAANGALEAAKAQLTELGSQLSAANIALAEAQAIADQLEAERDLLQAQVGTLTATVDGLITSIGALGCPLAGPLLCDQLAAAQAALATATAALNAKIAELDAALSNVGTAQGVVAALNDQITAVQDTIDALVAQLNDLIDQLLGLIGEVSLDDLLATIHGLVDGLEGFELLAIDRILVGVASSASATGSSASALCQVEGVRILGEAAPAALDTCAELQPALANAHTAVLGLLRDLPVVGAVAGGAVRFQGLGTSVSEPNQRQGDYYVGASSIEALTLAVEPISLTRVTDGLVADITGLVGGLVEQLTGLTGVDVDLAVVEAALADLLAAVGQLPTGDLTGLATPRFALQGLAASSGSSYRAAGSVAPPPVASPPAVPQVGTPTSTPPAQPARPAQPAQPQLPNTGGGLAAGLLMLAAGGFGAAQLRRRRA